MAAARAVALNPAPRGWSRAGLAPFERLSAHLAGRDDGLVEAPAAPRPGAEFRRSVSMRTSTIPPSPALRRNEPIGRPLGDRAFQDAISRRLGRAVTPGKRGPKPKRERDGG